MTIGVKCNASMYLSRFVDMSLLPHSLVCINGQRKLYSKRSGLAQQGSGMNRHRLILQPWSKFIFHVNWDLKTVKNNLYVIKVLID